MKYSSALKEKVIGHLKQMVGNVENDKFNISTEELTNDLSELTKIKEFFDKKQAIDESKKNSEKSS